MAVAFSVVVVVGAGEAAIDKRESFFLRRKLKFQFQLNDNCTKMNERHRSSLFFLIVKKTGPDRPGRLNREPDTRPVRSSSLNRQFQKPATNRIEPGKTAKPV